MEVDDYLKKLLLFEEKFNRKKQVLAKIRMVKAMILAYQNRQIPNSLPRQLAFSEAELFTDPILMELEDHLLDLRQLLIENFGVWHIFSKKWVADLQTFLGNSVGVEIMAGNGLLSTQIPNLLATDNLDWHGQNIEKPAGWQKIEKIDALDAVKKYALKSDYFLLAWAPDTSEADLEILKWLRSIQWQGKFIVIGEYKGATNSQKFWQEAKLELPIPLNQHHQAFDFINDQVFLVK